MARVTVEDCLEKVPNRFALVILASERARQLSRGASPLVDCDNKPAVTSLREIAEGTVRYREDVHETVQAFIDERRAAGFM
jgi:DNA-directed RNA polymerase subunit omega